MTPAELDALFFSDPSVPRIIGYGTDASIVREDGARAISITVQLLDRASKQPSGKWLWLQLQPEDALVLAAAILVHAREEGSC